MQNVYLARRILKICEDNHKKRAKERAKRLLKLKLCSSYLLQDVFALKFLVVVPYRGLHTWG